MKKCIIVVLLLIRALAAQSQCNTGWNLALGNVATSSSVQNAGTPANSAVDGNMTTRWSSLSTDNQYIYVDLGAAFPLCQVVLYWEAAYGKNFTIDLSNDASTWTTVATVTGNTSLTNTITIIGTARYVRMNGSLRGTTYGYSLYEMQVYGTTPTPACPTTNAALGKPAVASSLESAAYPASNAFDGVSTTRWSSAFSDPQYIYVDLGGIYTLCSVSLAWETAYGKNFTIDASNDAVTWTNLATVTGNTSLNNTIPVTGSGRYVRMYGTVRATGYGYSLFDFSVYGAASLPVTLTDFMATEPNNASVRLSWKTQQEVNNRDFLIERGTEDGVFLPIGQVPGHGTEDLVSSYQFIDLNPEAGINDYRLLQEDEDGHGTYSAIVSVDRKREVSDLLRVYPNPVQNRVTVEAPDHQFIESIELLSVTGGALYTKSSTQQSTACITMEAFPAGMYFIRIKANGKTTTQKLIKR